MIEVRFFAAAREAAGASRLELPWRDSVTALEVWSGLMRDRPALRALDASVSMAVNRRHVPRETPLKDGDELAFLPPVSGG